MATTPTIDRLITVATEAWAKQGFGAAPDIISIIIQIIMSLISGCVAPPATMAGYLAAHPILGRAIIRQQLRSSGYALHPQREAIYLATVDVASQGTEADVTGLALEWEQL